MPRDKIHFVATCQIFSVFHGFWRVKVVSHKVLNLNLEKPVFFQLVDTSSNQTLNRFISVEMVHLLCLYWAVGLLVPGFGCCWCCVVLWLLLMKWTAFYLQSTCKGKKRLISENVKIEIFWFNFNDHRLVHTRHRKEGSNRMLTENKEKRMKKQTTYGPCSVTVFF